MLTNKRCIFHIDINHCYAQIEEMKYPQLRDVPMAVGGHEETRHGIILAKNDMAKKYNIKTGESLREALEKCPQLLIIPPSYDDYIYYTDQVKKIYYEYSDHVESFGLDEAWIDYTNSQKLYGDPLRTAAHIQKRVLNEIGLTVSVGVSWNKVFAKLGSDMKKPSGLTEITHDNYQKLIWPLPASDLLYVGPATTRKLKERGVDTIGELAQYPLRHLKKYMGVHGEVIYHFANGYDPSPVQETDYRSTIKSVGNSMTMVHDTSSLEETGPVYCMLAEAVASRLKEEGMKGDVISVSWRNAGLDWFGYQHKIGWKTDISTEIYNTAMAMLGAACDFSTPLRAVGISVSGLSPAHYRQIDLFMDEEKREKARKMDLAMDEIRNRYGFYSIRRASTVTDTTLTDFNVKAEHTVHPVGYFQGRKML